jgi:hypothetical protein
MRATLPPNISLLRSWAIYGTTRSINIALLWSLPAHLPPPGDDLLRKGKNAWRLAMQRYTSASS